MENPEHFDVGFYEALETEIERKGIALGIDWTNAVEVQQILREAFDHAVEDIAAIGHRDNHNLARFELRGLVAVLLKSMVRSKGGYLYDKHGPVWDVLRGALRDELNRRTSDIGSTPSA